MAKSKKRLGTSRDSEKEHGNVFLHKSETHTTSHLAKQLIERIAKAQGIDPSDIKLDRINERYFSFSIDADGEVLAAVRQAPEVKALITESEATEIHMQPVRSQKVELPDN